MIISTRSRVIETKQAALYISCSSSSCTVAREPPADSLGSLAFRLAEPSGLEPSGLEPSGLEPSSQSSALRGETPGRARECSRAIASCLPALAPQDPPASEQLLRRGRRVLGSRSHVGYRPRPSGPRHPPRYPFCLDRGRIYPSIDRIDIDTYSYMYKYDRAARAAAVGRGRRATGRITSCE